VTDTLDPGYHITGIFNTLYPPFNDVRMRRAAMQALSQQDVMDALIGDPRFYKICGAIFGCGNPNESTAGADMILGGGDPEAAKKMLAEAGYDGTKVVQLHPTDLVLLRAPGFVAGDALKKAGFNMDIHALDWQTATSRFNS